MLKYIFCTFIGHNYELISHKSFPPTRQIDTVEVGAFPFEIVAIFLGYTKTVQKCRNCGKMNITLSVGE